VSSEVGLGHYILKAGGTYDVPRVLFGILLMACVGLLLTGSLSIVERRLFPWARFVHGIKG
jgi:ABC-type nitrate/sulfonate/bicarbonate transport system permease component